MHPAVVKNVGVWFDANFPFADDIHNICKICFLQLHDLRRVRQYLTEAATILAANALVSSHLDYCNFLFMSLSSLNMHKLQCIQNTLTGIVTNCNKYTRASLILKLLHWLAVEFPNCHSSLQVSSQWSSQLLWLSFVYSFWKT